MAGVPWGAPARRKQRQARRKGMVRVLEVGVHHTEEVVFWPVSVACRDNSGWGEYRRERDFPQIPTAEECSTGRERSRLAGGVPLPGKRTSNTSLPPISLEALTLCSFWSKRRYRSVCGLWLQRVIRRSEMNRKIRTLKYF